MLCLKSCLDIFLKRSIQTSAVNSHTVTYKSIAPRDMPAELDFNCSGHSDIYINLNSLSVHLRLVKTNGSDLPIYVSNKIACIITCYIQCLVILILSLKGKPVTLHETN
jgi:hypothetical protein